MFREQGDLTPFLWHPRVHTKSIRMLSRSAVNSETLKGQNVGNDSEVAFDTNVEMARILQSNTLVTMTLPSIQHRMTGWEAVTQKQLTGTAVGNLHSYVAPGPYSIHSMAWFTRTLCASDNKAWRSSN